VLKKYDLDSEQKQLLDRSFQEMTTREGWTEKFALINQAMEQAARKLMAITAKSHEQTMAIRKLQEAQFWFSEAVRKYEF
jgi:hypothetical protein